MPDIDNRSIGEPYPVPEYEKRIRDGQIPYQKCSDCRHSIFFPRQICPYCGSGRLSWEASSGLGTVYSKTIIPSESGGYIVCLVDLQEGFRMMSTVIDSPSADVHIGAEVQGIVEPSDDSSLGRVVFTLGVRP